MILLYNISIFYMLILLVISLIRIRKHISMINLAFYKNVSLLYKNKSRIFLHYIANFFDTHPRFRNINSLILLVLLLNGILLPVFHDTYTMLNAIRYMFFTFLMLVFMHLHKVMIYCLPLYHKLNDSDLKEYNEKIKAREELYKRELTYLEYCDLFYGLDKVKSKISEPVNKTKLAVLYFAIGFAVILVSSLIF